MRVSIFVILFIQLWSNIFCVEDNSEALLDLAREFRSGSQFKEQNLQRACHYYEIAIDKGDGKLRGEALFELSELLNQSPGLSKKHNAFSLLVNAADEGHKEAQHRLAVMYATGISNNDMVPMDASRSLLLEYMSALSGEVEASMGMGYRLLNGIGIPSSCEMALPFYEYAANHAADYIENLGRVPFVDRMKISDAIDPNAKWLKSDATAELIDYYASLAESGDVMAAVTLGNIYSAGTRLIKSDEAKAIYFYSMAADVGAVPNPQACGALGYLLAKRYNRVMNKNHRPVTNAYDQLMISPSQADANTNAVSTIDSNLEIDTLSITDSSDPSLYNATRIYELLSYAASKNDPHGGVGLGFAYMRGIGTPGGAKNYTTATDLFRRYINSHSDAGFYLGEIHMGDNGRSHSDINVNYAAQAYSISAQQGNILSLHRVSQMTQRGMGTVRSCTEAVSGFKTVAERGPWAQGLGLGHRLYVEGRKQAALYEFAKLAAVGVEVAQFNAAYILSKLHHPPMHIPTKEDMSAENTWFEDPDDQGQTGVDRFEDDTKVAERYANMSNKAAYLTASQWANHLLLSLSHQADPQLRPPSDDSSAVLSPGAMTAARRKQIIKIESEQRALILFALSASQANAESFLQLGDFYYYGLANLPVSHSEAAVYYQRAADLKHTQAIFNLGLMHEVGDGVSQDFHLAKRFYDQAAETDSKAKLVRNIALMVLEAHKSIDAALHHEYTSALLMSVLGSRSAALPAEYLSSAVGTVMRLDTTVREYLDEAVAAHVDQFNKLKAAMNEQYADLIAVFRRTTRFDDIMNLLRRSALSTHGERKNRKNYHRSGDSSSVIQPGGSTAHKSQEEQEEIEFEKFLLCALTLVFSILLFIKYIRRGRRARA